MRVGERRINLGLMAIPGEWTGGCGAVFWMGPMYRNEPGMYAVFSWENMGNGILLLKSAVVRFCSVRWFAWPSKELHDLTQASA